MRHDVHCPKRSGAVVQRYSAKKMLLEMSQNSQENTFVRVSFLIKEYCERISRKEYCEISKNTFSYRTPLVATSEGLKLSVPNYFRSAFPVWITRVTF